MKTIQVKQEMEVPAKKLKLTPPTSDQNGLSRDRSFAPGTKVLVLEKTPGGHM